MAASHELLIRRNRLTFVHTKLAERLEVSVQQVLGNRYDDGQWIGRFSTPGGLGVRVLPSLKVRSDYSRYYVTRVELDDSLDRAVLALSDIYNLTQSERVLVGYLARGFSLQDAAMESGRSILTVRTHAKSILRKTGAGSQAALLAMLIRELIS